MGEEDPDGEDGKEAVGLDRKDYFALAIAALETVLLPLVLLIAILVALLVLIR
jgi:hypothetical protein